jgi:hypothetical protein
MGTLKRTEWTQGAALLGASLALCFFAGCTAPAKSRRHAPIFKTDGGKLSGYWQAQGDPGYFIGLEGGSYTVAFGGQVRTVATILDFSESKLRVCEDGEETVLELSLEDNGLTLHDPRTSEAHQFHRLPQAPPDLKLLPLQIPEPLAVSADRAQQIEGELGRRVQQDQLAHSKRFEDLWGPPRLPEQGLPPSLGDHPLGTEDLSLLAIRSENTAYLKSLLAEVGWIDSRRFGSTAADAAFLLTQHSKDLPLMLAALPRIKEEVDAGRLEGDTYGKRQLYGTRMGKDASGQPIILPTEEPEGADERRRGLGMTPLSQYVGVFGAKEVRFSSACSPSRD